MLYQRENIEAYKVMNGLSTTAQAVSEIIPITRTALLSFEIVWTTSVARGEFSVEGSITGLNWFKIQPLSTVPRINASNGSHLLNLGGLGVMLIRLVFDPTTAGAGSIDAWISGKIS